MSLTKRIIPCLDINNGRVVKGINFRNLKDAGNPVELGKRYSEEGADELVYLDVSASLENRNIFSDVVRSIARELDIPFTVGGGIKTVDNALRLLSSGADKVSLNSAAVENPEIIREISDLLGSQCVVVAIDAKKVGKKYEVFTYSARASTSLDAIQWAKKASEMGAGELLVTAIDRDGTKKGFNLELLNLITESVNIPVIASGGAKDPHSFYEVFTQTNVDAALAASIFHYDQYPIPEVKRFLKQRGVVIR